MSGLADCHDAAMIARMKRKLKPGTGHPSAPIFSFDEVPKSRMKTSSETTGYDPVSFSTKVVDGLTGKSAKVFNIAQIAER